MLKRTVIGLTLVILLAGSIISCAGESTASTATLSQASGEVLLMRTGTDTWMKTPAGVVLNSGDRIKTGVNSSALITFFEGSTIELHERTEIGVEELSIARGTGSTTVKVLQEVGKTRSRVEKLVDPASRYEVETPAGAALVRGSIMDVLAMVTGLAIVDAVEDACLLRNLWGELLLPEGTRGYMLRGKAPSTSAPAVASPSPPSSAASSGSGGPAATRPIPIICQFVASPTSGYASLRVQFADLSMGRISSWIWTFGDGEASGLRNPVHVYSSPGVYTVSLTVAGVGGSASEIKHEYIVVFPRSEERKEVAP